MCSTVEGVQCRWGYHDACGDILSTVGDVQYHGDILSTAGDIQYHGDVLSTVGVSVPWGYHEYRGGLS